MFLKWNEKRGVIDFFAEYCYTACCEETYMFSVFQPGKTYTIVLNLQMYTMFFCRFFKKLSQISNQWKKEFMNEAKLLARVQHQNVVNLLDIVIME